MAKRQEDPPPAGSPAWMATFGDLMNLLLCFFVLLFSMSSVDAQKFELIAASFNQTFSIFSDGGTTIGDGILISNGASQLNELSEYLDSTGRDAEGEVIPDDLETAAKMLEEAQVEASEKLAEKIEEALRESQYEKDIEIEVEAQYVQLTLNGALLFDSGSAELKAEALPLLENVGTILQRYAESTIDVEGHTDNVPMSGPKYSDNDELSSGRALTVTRFLREKTLLDPSTFICSGRGEYVPVADNATAEGRSRNRRVEIKIYNALSSY